MRIRFTKNIAHSFLFSLVGFGGPLNAKNSVTVPPKMSPSAIVDVPAQGFEKSVLILSVSKQDIDIDSPWRFKDSTYEQHLGVVLGDGKILTTAFAVLNSSLIEMKKFGQPLKSPLKVEFVDYECNLALLTAMDPDALVETVPIEIGKDLAVTQEAWILNERNATQLIRNAARVAEVNVVNATTSALRLPAYLMKVQQTGLGWSEPVIRGQELVGLTTGQDENHVYALPAFVIQRFVEDFRSGHYRGFPGLGFEARGLVDPNLRKLLKANGAAGGVYISEIERGSGAATVLNVRDVVLELDGISLAEDGTYRHEGWGRMNLQSLVSQKRGGESLSLKILRDGQPLSVTMKLSRFDSNASSIVFDRYDSREEHVIFGGLIFQELSRDYLREWGREWRSVAPLDLLYLWEMKNNISSERVRKVVLNRVLADEYNQGYERLQNLVLRSVNGVEVHSIAQLRDALKRPIAANGGNFAVFRFDRDGGEVVLNYDHVDDAQMRIAKTYSINSPASFFLAH